MSEDLGFVWDRSDGQPWESVESLPPPLDADTLTSSPPPWEQTTYPGPYYDGTPSEYLCQDDELMNDTQHGGNEPQPKLWEELESLPSPLDKRESYGPEPPRGRNAEEEGREDAEEIQRSPRTPRGSSHPMIRGDVSPLYDMGYIDLSRRGPLLSQTRSPYSLYPISIPPNRRRPGLLAIDPSQGRVDHGHNGHMRTPGHPPVIPLSTLIERLGISAPIYDPRRQQRRRARNPLSSPPRELTSREFVIEDVSYEAREDRLYGDGREIIFPKTPDYLPPVVKVRALSLRGRSEHDDLPKRRQGRAEDGDAWAPDPRYDWCGTELRGGHDSVYYPTTGDGRERRPKGINIDTVWRDMERSAQVQKKTKSKLGGSRRRRERRCGSRDIAVEKVAREEVLWWSRPGYRGRGRGYFAANGSGGGKKTTVDDEKSAEDAEVRNGKDRSEVQFEGHDTAYTSGPQDHHNAQDDEERSLWTDIDDHVDIDAGRGRQRRRSVDGSEVDVYESAHYHPEEPRPFNVKRIPDQARKTLRAHGKYKGKWKAPTPTGNPDGEDPDDIHGASDPDLEVDTESKKPGPYEAFKKTTGRHPKHFHIYRQGEAVERFVLDRKPLDEGEEEPTGRNWRRPMIDVVDVKTGERTRKKIRGYDKIPKMIKVAAGVEMLTGRLPPSRRREVEEVEGQADGGEGGGETTEPRRRGKESRKKRKWDGCRIM